MIKYYFLLILSILLLCGCRSSIVDDPSTLILYTISQPSNVKLTIENSYNTVVATLVDGYMTPGTYSISFDMSGLMEGVYFYTLECKGVNSDYYYKSEKLMLLIK